MNNHLQFSCIDRSHSFLIRNNGSVVCISKINGDFSVYKFLTFMPVGSYIQILTVCWEDALTQYLVTSFPLPSIKYSLTDISMKNFKSVLNQFSENPKLGFEAILALHSKCNFTGENVIKTMSEQPVFELFGGISFDELIPANTREFSTHDMYLRIGDTYGNLLCVSGFKTLEGLKVVPNESFFLSTFVQKCRPDEAEVVKQNTIGTQVFSSSLKKKKFDVSEMESVTVFSFAHTICLLDRQTNNIKVKNKAISDMLLRQGIAINSPELKIRDSFISCIPGHGDISPNLLYLDKDDTAEALKVFQSL